MLVPGARLVPVHALVLFAQLDVALQVLLDELDGRLLHRLAHFCFGGSARRLPPLLPRRAPPLLARAGSLALHTHAATL